ncbi:unnamed protein product [Chrysodeixis includens]|uniref:Uncharacterized protein n=1 Tax=Chrysodeixis includens TaxID=689277 RepID=A0A9N8L0H9_CHRIL|nr:unnamed protein product [Chrysodeixis includens]
MDMSKSYPLQKSGQRQINPHAQGKRSMSSYLRRDVYKKKPETSSQYNDSDNYKDVIKDKLKIVLDNLIEKKTENTRFQVEGRPHEVNSNDRFEPRDHITQYSQFPEEPHRYKPASQDFSREYKEQNQRHFSNIRGEPNERRAPKQPRQPNEHINQLRMKNELRMQNQPREPNEGIETDSLMEHTDRRVPNILREHSNRLLPITPTEQNDRFVPNLLMDQNDRGPPDQPVEKNDGLQPNLPMEKNYRFPSNVPMEKNAHLMPNILRNQNGYPGPNPGQREHTQQLVPNLLREQNEYNIMPGNDGINTKKEGENTKLDNIRNTSPLRERFTLDDDAPKPLQKPSPEMFDQRPPPSKKADAIPKDNIRLQEVSLESPMVGLDRLEGAEYGNMPKMNADVGNGGTPGNGGKPEPADIDGRPFIPDNIGREGKLSLPVESRKNLQKCLGKKATKLCTKSCVSAYKNVCTRLKCSSRSKKALKKECKRSCKKAFVTSKYDSDES